MKYRRNQNVGLFDKENTLQELLENGNPLPKLKEIIDFEQFRSILEPVFENAGKKSNAGRKPFDPSMSSDSWSRQWEVWCSGEWEW